MHRHYGRMLRALSVGRMKSSSCSLWQPPVDMYESDSELIVFVEVAGIAPDKIKIMAENEMLTISGERKCLISGVNHVHRLEIEYGHFACRIPLPVSIDVDKTKSEINNGFLLVRMPVVRHQGTVEINLK
ncbi:MAG: Hsp20/alpha crystallin family protein [Desulfobulbaceae bacterium]|nr:Hsp20/alpha crystallin family protein [Desulfobulbaceae bacterium]